MHTGQLGRRSTHNRNKAGSVNDAPALGKTLLRLSLVPPHGEDGVFGSPPDAFDVYLHRQIPDFLFRVQRVVVCGVHDPGVVELFEKKR